MAWLPAKLKSDKGEPDLWINTDFLVDVYDKAPYVEAYVLESEYCYLIDRETWMQFIMAEAMVEVTDEESNMG